jgi:hypothetical protein
METIRRGGVDFSARKSSASRRIRRPEQRQFLASTQAFQRFEVNVDTLSFVQKTSQRDSHSHNFFCGACGIFVTLAGAKRSSAKAIDDSAHPVARFERPSDAAIAAYRKQGRREQALRSPRRCRNARADLTRHRSNPTESTMAAVEGRAFAAERASQTARRKATTTPLFLGRRLPQSPLSRTRRVRRPSGKMPQDKPGRAR